MYEKLHFVSRSGVKKISSVACWYSSTKVHYSVNRINEVYGFFFQKTIEKLKEFKKNTHT